MKGKNGEIERIVKAYSDLLLRLVLHDTYNRSEAEDIVQNTFIKYLQKAPKFKDMQHEKAWFIRVASNQVKDVHRSWWHRKTIELNEDMTISEPEYKDAYQLLPYIRKLPQGSRYAIYLFYYEGYSISQIATIYQVKENTVASWLHRGRVQLKHMLEGVSDDDMG